MVRNLLLVWIVFLCIFLCNLNEVNHYIHFFYFAYFKDSTQHLQPKGDVVTPSSVCMILSSVTLNKILLNFTVNKLSTSLLNLCCGFLRVFLFYFQECVVELKFSFSFCYTLFRPLFPLVKITIVCKIFLHKRSQCYKPYHNYPT